MVLASIPVGAGLTEPGAGGDDRAVTLPSGGAGVEHRDVARFELAKTIGDRFEVVDQVDVPQPDDVAESPSLDAPREIRRDGMSVADGSSDGEARALRR